MVWKRKCVPATAIAGTTSDVFQSTPSSQRMITASNTKLQTLSHPRRIPVRGQHHDRDGPTPLEVTPEIGHPHLGGRVMPVRLNQHHHGHQGNERGRDEGQKSRARGFHCAEPEIQGTVNARCAKENPEQGADAFRAHAGIPPGCVAHGQTGRPLARRAMAYRPAYVIMCVPCNPTVLICTANLLFDLVDHPRTYGFCCQPRGFSAVRATRPAVTAVFFSGGVARLRCVDTACALSYSRQ